MNSKERDGEAIKEFTAIIQANKNGIPRGVYSVCSAHEGVIRASMAQAMDDDSILLVESTSNQVNQHGGYTGMKPVDFAAYINRLAGEAGFPAERLLLGGDHLGPNPWRQQKADDAMAEGRRLIQDYVASGYKKIHLDASMFLADDDGDPFQPLAEPLVAERTAALCSAAEKTWESLSLPGPPPLYIIGTEVPIPGGARNHESDLGLTPAEDARRTVETTRRAFVRAGLEAAWERVCAVVVQPGVEFGDDQVFDYDAEKAAKLIHALDDVPGMVFEAHSTDYQSPRALAAMVEGHFCIQKVGPWLTFAWREALFALSHIEDEYLDAERRSRLREVLEDVMLENPQHWKDYYRGSAVEMRIKRKFSYSDRSRYYWPDKRLEGALKTLFNNLRLTKISPSLLCQFLPDEYRAWRLGQVSLDPENLAMHHVRTVLKTYSQACRMHPEDRS